MDELVRSLSPESFVLDLGAGPGSFDYQSTAARVLAADLSFPASAQAASGRILSPADSLPLQSESCDVVICNHTLEHFENLPSCIREIDRVLKSGGHLWVAVPDSTCLDDRLYRYLFEGGGHINPFTLSTLIGTLEKDTGLRALRYKKLHSGFVYLNPPDPKKLPYYPPRAQRLAQIRPGLSRFFLRWINKLVRTWDRLSGTNFSQYGWGVVFVKDDGPETKTVSNLTRMPADLNVCCQCGSGHPRGSLQEHLKRRWFLPFYHCPQCKGRNIYSRDRG